VDYETAETSEPQNLVEQTLGLSAKQIVEYAKAKDCLKPCEACGSRGWEFPLHSGKPSLLLSHSARDRSVAEWHFQLVCKNCGNNRLLSAGYVWAHYFRPGEPA
jgi:hypothetical protein